MNFIDRYDIKNKNKNIIILNNLFIVILLSKNIFNIEKNKRGKMIKIEDATEKIENIKKIIPKI